MANQEYKILQIMPADGWIAKYHDDQKPGQWVGYPLVCWGLVEWPNSNPNGFRSIEGFLVNGDEHHRAADTNGFIEIEKIDVSMSGPCDCTECRALSMKKDYEKAEELRNEIEARKKKFFSRENLSVRTIYCLKNAGIDTLAKLCSLHRQELLRIPNLGKITMEEIERSLKGVGLKLKDDDQ